MSTSHAKVRDYAINAALGLIASIFLLFGTGAWNRKENVADHQLDMLRTNDSIERVLDILCSDKPTLRACETRPASAGGDVVPHTP